MVERTRYDELLEKVDEALAIEAEPSGRVLLHFFAASAHLALDQPEAAVEHHDGMTAELARLEGEGSTLLGRRELHAVIGSKIARGRGGDADLAALEQGLQMAWSERVAAWRELPIEDSGRGFFHEGEPRRLLSECIDVRLERDPSRGARAAALQQVLDMHSFASTARRLGARATVDECSESCSSRAASCWSTCRPTRRRRSPS